MASKSAAIRRDFASHRLSAGEYREDLVGNFLKSHLPKRFGISTGLVISHNEKFSNQADLVVVDELNNAPFYPESRKQLWPVEALYALIEVKTHLNPSDLKDAIKKGRRFKSLPRQALELFNGFPIQRGEGSLFVIWAFESSEPRTLKGNLIDALSDVPIAEQPDLIIVPEVLVAQSGRYMELTTLGHPNSQYRRSLESKYGQDLSRLVPEPAKVYDLRKNSLMAWYVWFDSWLRHAGPRFYNPISYLPPDEVFGNVI